MSDNLAPELVERIEEIVVSRLREELDARAQLVTLDQFTQAMERMDRHFEELIGEVSRGFEAADRRFEAMQAQIDRRFDESNRHSDAIMEVVLDIRS
jgi:hypothetical protein